MALSTVRGTPTYANDATTGNGWLTSGVVGTTTAGAWDNANGGIVTVRVRTSASSGVKVALGNNGSGNNGIWIGLSGGKPAFALNQGIGNVITGGFFTSGGASIADGAWHVLQLKIDSSYATLTVDGTIATNSTYTDGKVPAKGGLTWGAGTYAIGGFGATSDYDWSGSIDYLHITDLNGVAFVSEELGDAAVGPLVANAGSAQSVPTGSPVTLTGSATGGFPAKYTYSWAQTSGFTVALSSTTAASPTFTAPSSATTLGFTLTVSDGTSTTTATTTVAVAAASSGGTAKLTTTLTPASSEAFVQFKHLDSIQASGVSGGGSSASALSVQNLTSASSSFSPSLLGASQTASALVMFVQDATGNRAATVGGIAVNLNPTANSRTLVQVVPTGGSNYTLIYPGTTLYTLSNTYPARPPLAPGCVKYKGPTQPTDWLTGDTWEQVTL